MPTRSHTSAGLGEWAHHTPEGGQRDVLDAARIRQQRDLLDRLLEAELQDVVEGLGDDQRDQRSERGRPARGEDPSVPPWSIAAVETPKRGKSTRDAHSCSTSVPRPTAADISP